MCQHDIEPCSGKKGFNPLSHMPILGSTNLAANKDIMSKIWTNGDSIIRVGNIVGKRKQEGHDGPVSLHWLILENLFET